MSDPSRYKYSLHEDPSDAGALNKALGRLSVKDPESFGGHYYESDQTKPLPVAQFATHVPPDVTSNTHVFGVLGIKQADARPGYDGWFLSDFFAFWHLLQGATKNKQHWLHGLDLDILVDQHKEYLHGNPYKERKVVLNRELLDKAQDKALKDSVTRINAYHLKAEFRKRFVSVCKAAAAANENVVLLVFAHGYWQNNGVVLGQGGAENSTNFRFDTLVKELRGINVNICLISTACGSGGWLCQPSLQLTGFAAAGVNPKDPSTSWAKSGSSGRLCGSIFASLIAGNLTKGWLSDDDYDDLTEVQGKSIAEFVRTIYHSLLELHDRLGYQHRMTFSAQDDAWSMHWQQRTGLPLADFAQRWNALPNYPKDPTLHPGDPLNRDPTVSQDIRDEFLRLEKAHVASGGGQTYEPLNRTGSSQSSGSQSILGKRKASSLYGGSIEAMRSQVLNLGRLYKQSIDTVANNAPHIFLDNLLDRIAVGKETGPEEIETALVQLDFRMSAMSTADRYREFMEVPLPLGQRCYEWNHAKNYKYRSPLDEPLDKLVREHFEVLFPRPLERQGHPFHEPMTYLMIACTVAGLSLDVIREKLDTLVEIVKSDLQEQERLVKENPEVKTKRQKLWYMLGKVGNMSPVKSRSRSRSASPKKRRSRGQSLSGMENVGSSSRGRGGYTDRQST